jgi:hypothetical protein
MRELTCILAPPTRKVPPLSSRAKLLLWGLYYEVFARIYQITGKSPIKYGTSPQNQAPEKWDNPRIVNK